MDSMKTRRPARTPGRPRAFDPDRALDRALEVFWRKGYEGASLSDLTSAMRINRPSLYAAFGDKQTLFRRALDRYAEGPASHALAGSLLSLLKWWLDHGAKESAQEMDELFHAIAWNGLRGSEPVTSEDELDRGQTRAPKPSATLR